MKHKALLNPQLIAFMAVAKHKSMHGGAREIHLTQTAITQRIQNLEANLRTTLFIRKRYGVEITPEGESLLRYCYTVSSLSGETLANIADAGVNTPIRIGITGPTSIMISRIIPQCMIVMKKFPNLFINFDIDDTAQRINTLRTGINQFAILDEGTVLRELNNKPLFPEKYLLMCSYGWKNRQLRDIIRTERIIDFNALDQMSFNYLKRYKLLKFAKPERLFVNRTESLAKLIGAGYGYGVLTEEFALPFQAAKSLFALNSGRFYENRLTLAWYDRPMPPPYVSELIETIQ